MPTAQAYRQGLKDAALIGLRHDLHAAGATDEQIDTAADELRAALAQVTVARFPDPGDFALEVASVAQRVTAQFAQ
jgi:hypothetical protein